MRKRALANRSAVLGLDVSERGGGPGVGYISRRSAAQLEVKEDPHLQRQDNEPEHRSMGLGAERSAVATTDAQHDGNDLGLPSRVRRQEKTCRA